MASTLGEQSATASMYGGAATAGVGLMTGGTGFLISGLIQLAGGILGGLTRKEPPMSPQDRYFMNMVGFYSNLGKRHKAASSMYTAFTGKAAPQSLQFNFDRAWDTHGAVGEMPSSNMPGAKSTYEGD